MHRFLLAAAACCFCLSATAQWQWLDKDGRKVFSDRLLPPEIPEKNILRQPGGRDAHSYRALPAADTASAPGAAASTPSAGKDKDLEEKKAQAEAAEAAKKKAEDEKIAKAKAENCTRARAAKAAFDAGKPITQANAQGEKIFLDGPARAAEAKRIDEIVASDCVR